MANLVAGWYERLSLALKAQRIGSAVSENAWENFNQRGITWEAFVDLLDSDFVKGYSVPKSVSGAPTSVLYLNPAAPMENLPEIAEEINSNVQSGTASAANTFSYSAISDAIEDQATGNIDFSGGVTKYNDGVAASPVKVGTGLVAPALVAAGLGVQLGRAVDSAIYSVADALNLNPPRALDPNTWDEIAEGQEGFLADAFRAIYCFNPLGELELYLNQDAIGLTAQWINENNWFGTEETDFPDYTDTGRVTITSIGSITALVSLWLSKLAYSNVIVTSSVSDAIANLISQYGDNKVASITGTINDRFPGTTSEISIFDLNIERSNVGVGSNYRLGTMSDSVTLEVRGDYNRNTDTLILNRSRVTHPYAPIFVGEKTTVNSTFTSYRISNIDVTSTRELPDGIIDNGTPAPNTAGWTDTTSTINSLRQQYPDLWENRIENTIPDGHGGTRTITYIPWQMPSGGEGNNPDTQIDTPDYTVNPETATATKLQTIIDLITRATTTQIVNPETDPSTGTNETNPTAPSNPPDTGTGNQSPFDAPTGSASSLWAVYHPSQAQLNAFGAWLWSSDFVEQLKRLFNDPMQAIIGVHKVFAPIPTGGSQNIKCGYLDSGVSSPVVSSQYTEVSCGTVNCREYFGNVFDYDPHTSVSIYLPFIGVVPLKVSEVMRASITVTYGVDVITGACLAKVKVDRDGGGAILYSFGGSCACHYPISAGSYAGIISGIVSSAVGVAGGIVSGNPLAAVGGVLAGARQAHTEVQHSGGFTGCAGAMGPKKPYLIITRPQTRVSNDIQLYEGKPSNATQFIGDCTGFVRATEVHFSSQAAFNDEAKEIEALLKSGVLISD